MTILVGILVFFAAGFVDYAHAHYAFARDDGREHAASCWAVLQWCAAVVGFVAAIRMSLWILPAEGAGIYAGTLVAVRKHKARQVASEKS